jgi:hypothetical protein
MIINIMDFRYDAYCGLNCGACMIRTAFVQKRYDLIPKIWRENSREKKFDCAGCKNDSVYENCQHCSIRSCAKTKKVEYCMDCTEYPCDLYSILKQRTHFQVTKDNPKRIRQMGLESWIVVENNRWKCSKCGIQYSWYEEICAKCGTKLFNVVEEAKMNKNSIV